jgi:hypothetical protein
MAARAALSFRPFQPGKKLCRREGLACVPDTASCMIPSGRTRFDDLWRDKHTIFALSLLPQSTPFKASEQEVHHNAWLLYGLNGEPCWVRTNDQLIKRPYHTSEMKNPAAEPMVNRRTWANEEQHLSF